MTDFDKMIAAAVDQALIGNRQIAKGNNSTMSHIYISEVANSVKGLLAMGHKTCDAIRAAKAGYKGSRADFIAGCVEAGVNKSTASVQYSKA